MILKLFKTQKMIKKVLFTVLAITVAHATYGQTLNVNLPPDYLSNNTLGGKNNIPADVQGSPYIVEDFLVGTVFIKEESYNAEMRYNAYLDEVQAKTQGQVTSLLKRDYVSARIGNQLYTIVEYADNGATRQGYFVELNPGKTRLLLQQKKKFVQAVKAESTYKSDTPAKFVEQKEYFLKVGDEPAVRVRLKKKDILAQLGNKKEMDKFISENGLKLKNEGEIIQLLKYHGSL